MRPSRWCDRHPTQTIHDRTLPQHRGRLPTRPHPHTASPMPPRAEPRLGAQPIRRPFDPVTGEDTTAAPHAEEATHRDLPGALTVHDVPELMNDAVARWREQGELHLAATSLQKFGHELVLQDQLPLASRAYGEAAAIFLQFNAERDAALVLTERGLVLLVMGKAIAAQSVLRDANTLFAKAEITCPEHAHHAARAAAAFDLALSTTNHREAARHILSNGVAEMGRLGRPTEQAALQAAIEKLTRGGAGSGALQTAHDVARVTAQRLLDTPLIGVTPARQNRNRP